MTLQDTVCAPVQTDSPDLIRFAPELTARAFASTPTEPGSLASLREPGVTSGSGVPRAQAAHPFVGRRAELREISARAATAASGQPQTVVIEGVPGIGKTTLLQRALRDLPDFSSLRASCSLGGAAQQLISTAGPAPASGPADPAPELADSLLRAVQGVLASGWPVVIAIDDVQWIDARSAAAICSVLSALSASPVLTIVTARSRWQCQVAGDARIEQPGHQLPGAVSDAHLRVAELSLAEVAKLFEDSAPGDVQQAAQRLHAYTGGHPALLSVLLQQGAAMSDRLPGELLGLSDPLVTGILHAVSCLPASSRELLAGLAVLQERWPLAAAGSLARVDDPFAALEPLLELGLVEWYPADPVTPVAIRYPLYRDIIYRSLPAASRRVLHGRAASLAIGPRALSHHAAARHDSASVAATVRLEAGRYYLAGDSEQAGTLLMASAAAASDPAERERCIAQAAHWWLTLRAVDWGPKLEASVSGWPPSAGRSLILGLLAETAGRYQQARATVAEARELLAAQPVPPLLQADIDLATALLHADLGDSTRQSSIAEQLLTLDALPAAHRAWAEHHAAAAAGALHGGPLAALMRLAQAVPDDVLDGHGESAQAVPGSQSVRLWSRGSWRVLSGQLRDGLHDLARMLRSADRAAAGPVLPLAHALMGYAYHLLGEWGAAEEATAQALAALKRHGVARLRVPVHAIAACVEARAGRYESAAQHARAAKRCWHETGPESYAAFPALAGATIAQARGDHAWTIQELQPLTCRPGLGDECVAWWLPLQVEALIETCQVGEAGQALGRLRDLAAASGRHETTVGWLDARLAAARLGAAAARERFEEALARQPGPDDVPLHRAHLERDYGRLLMSGRNRRSAITRLRNAQDIYETVGARPFAERCAADLEACGAHERGMPGHRGGRASSTALSSREQKVAYLASAGLTNQEIAGELFVTVKTVEYHLGNAFAKLGISSRRQLAACLGEEPAA